MKKLLFRKIGFSLFVMALAFLWTTCDVGLGESVDNFAPSVVVTGPIQASVCKGSVNITGTCSDDKGVLFVSVTVKNTTTGVSYPFSGNINLASRSALGAYDWSTTINQMGADGKFPLPDGKYEANVTATDVAGRVSGVSSTSFDIDNTPPIFCVTSPKSLVINGSKVYGRSVTISGEIADDHDIEKMEIRVYKTDANGDNPVDITSNLAKTTFTDFETAGGTTIYIAKYFENEPPASSSDHDLWKNYNAIYGGAVTDTNKDDDMFIYLVPVLTDKAGNKSEWSYVSTEVKKRIAAVCGVDPAIDSLQTGQLQKIYNGTYTLGELNADQRAAALKVLNGDDAEASKYYCGVDPRNTSKEYRFAATVNSNNSPTYEFISFEVPISAMDTWQEVNTGGTVNINLKAGRDGWGIYPNKLVVNLYASNITGAKNELRFSSSESKDPSGKATLPIQNTENVDTKTIGTSVTNQSYHITLPALKAGDYYLLEAEGIDENDSDLVPFGGRSYGFRVSQSINPPTVTAADLFYIAGEGAKSTSDYKLRINIKDESDLIQDSNKGLVIDGYLYEKHISSKAYISSYDNIKPAAKNVTIIGDTAIVKDSDNNYHTDLAIKDFGFTIDAGKNYTVVLDVKAKYKSADGSSVETTKENIMMFWVDNKAPELEMKSPKSGDTLITENFSSYEKNGGAVKITPEGTWSDKEGSSTHRLWYTTSDDGTPALEWTAASGTFVKGTNYYEKQAAGCYAIVDTDRFVEGETSVADYYTLKLNSSDTSDANKIWTEITDVSQVASPQTKWEKKIEVSEGTDKIFRVVGVDAVGNLSAVVGSASLKYDFAVPTIALTSEPASNGYYNLSNADSSNKLAISFVATDSYKIDASGVTVTAAKNGAAASSGYTLDIKQAKNSQGQDDPTKVIVTITLTAGGSSDGKWKFTVNAKDVAGRDAAPIELERIVDTVKPAFVAYSNSETNTAIRGKIIAVGSGDKSKWTYWDGSWYSVTGFVFNGNLKEETSGVKKVCYRLAPAGLSTEVTGEQSISGDTRTGTEAVPLAFAIAANGFEQSKRDEQTNALIPNSLYIWAEDEAGNRSDETNPEINIDQSQPNFAAAWYTYSADPSASDLAAAEGTILSDGTKALTVYGTVSSVLSGVESLGWQIAGNDATSNLTSLQYTTAALSAADSYINSATTWSALSALDPTAVTGWKAVIPSASVLAGDVFVTAKNKAQKITKAQIFTIDRDEVAPTINLNTPDTMIAAYKSVAAGTSTAPDYKPATKPDGSTIPTVAASVNGTIKITGNASDNKDLSDVKVYWSLNGDASIDTSGSDPRDHIISDIGASIYNWSVAAYEFSKLNTDKTKFLFADGTEYNGNEQTVYIKVEAADKAQNNTITVYKYSVNPDSDRPKITFTAPDDLSAMTSTNYILKKSASVLRGKVEDDDGLTGLKLYYKEKDAADWTELTLTSGAFEIFNDTEDHDGKHELLFKVVDAKGTTFITSNGSDNSWLRPKIHKAGSGNTETFFGGDATSDSTVYIAIDTKKPEITNKSYFVGDNPPADAKEGPFTALPLLGGKKNKFTLYFYAKDASGLDENSISVKFNGNTYTKGGSTYKLTIASSTNPALQGYSFITVKDIAIPANLPSGSNYDGTITVKDKAGLENTSSFTAAVDNDAPALTIINPAQRSNQTVSGGVNAYGTVNGADNETKLYYALTYEDDTHTAAAATTEPTGDGAYAEIKQKSMLQWYVYFDGGVSSEEQTHANTFNQYLISKGATIGGVEATADEGETQGSVSNGTFKLPATGRFKDGIPIYLWIKAVDAVGNEVVSQPLYDDQGEFVKYVPYKILFDPQGSKPTVSFSYPSANGETMGGEIKVYGGAKSKDKNNPTIKAVFAQIISKSHELTGYSGGTTWGTLTTDAKATTISAFEPSKNDLDYLKAAGYKVYKMRAYNSANPTASEWKGTLASGETAADYGVLASVNGSSWSLKINANGEFDPKAAAAGETATTNIAAVRVFSYDGVNLSNSDERAFIVDSDTPQLKDLQLEQFGVDGTSATSTASREYEEDIYVTGKWFLTFNLTDGQAMGVVRIGKGDSADAAASSGKVVTYLGKDASGSVKDFTNPGTTGPNYGVVTRPTSASDYTKLNVKLPLETNSGCGTQYVYVYFEDASGKGGSTAAKVYKISYDNMAPVLAKTSDDKYAVHSSVQQNDGWYSFGSKVSEPKQGSTDQSGFERLAFYFTRGTEIFDPMIKKNATGNRISTSDLIPDSGLYWKSVTVTRDENNLNTLTLGTADDNIHKGGLAKLDGVIYRIDDLPDEKTVTISGSPKIKKDNNGNPITSVSALFAVANVVDNEIQESSDGTRRTTDYGFGYNTPSNDDGDLMVESIVNDNTDWTWNASIYSKNIPDGPVQIHYVAFDKAGNWSQAGGSSGATSAADYDPPVVAATVSNNAPRIANLYVGTDLNGNNEIDGNFNGATSDARKEWSAPYKDVSLTWNQDTNSGTAVKKDATLLKGTEDSPKAYLTAKGMTVLRPEILGGNGNIYYSYKIYNATEGAKESGTPFASGSNSTTPFISAAQIIANPMADETARNGNITIQVGDFKHLKKGGTGPDKNTEVGIPDCAEASPHKFEFTFYDETEDSSGAVPTGEAIFSGSNTAKATVYMAVEMNDSVEPKATRENLFWNGAGAPDNKNSPPKNSIAWDDKGNPLGHIELGDDQLPEGSPKDLPSIFNGAALAAEDAKDGVARDATLMDRDSKVSGKIVLRGTVSDNKMLYHIYLNIPAMSTQFAAAKNANANFGYNANYGYMAATYNAASGDWTMPVDTAATLGSYGIKFTVKDDKITSSKHSANWEFVWDTCYINNVAATNVTVDVYASDQVIASAVDNTNGTYTSLDGTQKYAAPVATENKFSVTAGNHPVQLQVDVVPYITGLKTFLSDKGDNFARTSLGHWPVYLRKDSTTTETGYAAKAGTPETFTVKGFNLNAEVDAKGNKGWTKAGQSISSSGWFVVKPTVDVNGTATVIDVPSLNNINNNNAALSGTDYNNAYNRQPNSKTNLLLTDDVYIDVWQLNGMAAVPNQLKIETPTMKINPNNGMIGFAFRYGTANKQFAMPNTNNSYQHWHTAADIQNSVTLAYNTSGASFGTVAGGESGNNGSDYTDFFSFNTSLWGPETGGTVGGNNRVRIELTGQYGAKTMSPATYSANYTGAYSNTASGTTVSANEKTKHQSPVIATYGTNVYLAYYDSFNNELRFRSSLGNNFGDAKTTVGNFVDQYTDYYITGNNNRVNAAKYKYTNCQIVAQKNTPVTGGEHVGLAAKSGAVAIVWYGMDNSTGEYKLWYSYNSTPNVNRAGTINTQTETAGDGWTKPKAIFAAAGKTVSGEFCKIAFDGAGKAHIAAYDSASGDVWYAYLSDPADASTAIVCRVDSNGTVGENLTLDVAMDDTETTKAIPVIGYFASSGNLPKIARPKVAGAFSDGVTNGKFTGNWEVSYVPTKSAVEQDNVNVGVWKNNSTGVLTNSNARTGGTPGATVGNSYYKTDVTGVCYGNGSKNAVLGYRHTDSTNASKGYIETAQLTGDPTKAY